MVELPESRVLVERAKRGDREAFSALIEKFGRSLRSRIEIWARSRVGLRLDVDELLQDSFVRAFRGLHGFEWTGDDAFFRWLCGIAKIALAEAARQAYAGPGRLADGVSTSSLPDPRPTPSSTMRRKERFDRLEAAVETLPPDYRQVVTLSRIHGWTMKEIAEEMGRTPNAVKHLLVRALRELRRTFGDTESFHLPAEELDPESRLDGQ